MGNTYSRTLIDGVDFLRDVKWIIGISSSDGVYVTPL